jgi:hypothetical protein
MSTIGPLMPGHSLNSPDGKPPSWMSATIVCTPWRRSRGTRRLMARASSPKRSPRTPAWLTIRGVPCSVTPTKAIGTPPARRMTYGASSRPPAVRRTFAAR